LAPRPALGAEPRPFKHKNSNFKGPFWETGIVRSPGLLQGVCYQAQERHGVTSFGGRRNLLSLRQIYFLYLYPDGRIDRRTFVLGLVPLLIAGVGVHLVCSMSRPVWFFFDVFLVLFALVLTV